MNQQNEIIAIFSCMGMVTACGLIFYHRKRLKNKRWVNRRWWVRPINRKRDKLGSFNTLFQEMKADQESFFRYTRMSLPIFNELLGLIFPYLERKSRRNPIAPEQRLAITLRYLATGDQIYSIALAYRVGESTARNIIKETCNVIGQVLGPKYLKVPTEQNWKRINMGFLKEWNLPNCIGAIDGKHITIQAPANSGSLFYNYKHNFSVVLMAACDYEYTFTLCDIGAYGSESDAGVLARSWIGERLDTCTLNIPQTPATLPGVEHTSSYYFITDSAFQMTTNMMRPYKGRFLNERQRIFNYRLSRGRRVIENAFGILVSRWRVLRSSICAFPDTVNGIVLATLCLHNFLKSQKHYANRENNVYCPPDFVDREDESGNIIQGEWRNDDLNNLQNITPLPPHRAAQAAYLMRDRLSEYFATPEGQVPWQVEHVRRGLNG